MFEGQAHGYGMSVATAGSAKAAGLNATTEATKPTNKAAVKTNMAVHLEKPVAEQNPMDLADKPTTKPNFYKINDDEWSQYPILLLVLGLMVERAVDDSFVQADDQDQDFA